MASALELGCAEETGAIEVLNMHSYIHISQGGFGSNSLATREV